MHTPDIILLLIVLVPGVITGAKKGFIFQVVTIAAILLGARLSFYFADALGNWLKQYVTASENVLYILSFAGIFIAVYLAFLALGKLALSLVKGLLGGWVDKVLGIVFGVAKYALLFGLLLIVVYTVNSKFGLIKQESLDASKVCKGLVDFANFVFPYLKSLVTKG